MILSHDLQSSASPELSAVNDSKCFGWISPACPPKRSLPSVLQSAVLISDAERRLESFSHIRYLAGSEFLLSYLLCSFLSGPAPWSCSPASLLDNQLHVSDLFLSGYLFCSSCVFSRSQLWKGLEHILMQFCMSAVYLSYLFPEVLLSTSYAVTEVGLFIMTRISLWIVLFSNCRLSLFRPRPSVPSCSAAPHVADERMLWVFLPV